MVTVCSCPDDGYWLCQSAVTPIPVWDSEVLLIAYTLFRHGRGCLPFESRESRYCPIRRADRPSRLTDSRITTHLKQPDRCSYLVSRTVGFIPALKREAFSSILRKNVSRTEGFDRADLSGYRSQYGKMAPHRPVEFSERDRDAGRHRGHRRVTPTTTPGPASTAALASGPIQTCYASRSSRSTRRLRTRSTRSTRPPKEGSARSGVVRDRERITETEDPP